MAKCETVCIENKELGYIRVNKGSEPKDAKVLTDKQVEAIDAKRKKAEGGKAE